MMFGEKVLAFNRWVVRSRPDLPRGTSYLLTFDDEEVKRVTGAFYARYYDDERNRCFLFGINPGRLGAGITGIPFTDPVRLANDCGIPHAWPLKPELSADFMYRMISYIGGVQDFYRRFFVTSVCPLGLLKGEKNLNYYDEVALYKRLEPFIVKSVEKQLEFGCHSQRAWVIGEGKNMEVFAALNDRYGWFQELVGLPHPRFIMQYKRKQLTEHLSRYAQSLTGCPEDTDGI